MKKTFSQWIQEVDAAVYSYCGLSYLDLSDISYADLYEDGVSAKSAAKKAIKASGGF